MLVLGRKRDETVVITVLPSTEPIVVTVTVVDTTSSKVRIGFEAPKHVAVMRGEVQEQIDANARKE